MFLKVETEGVLSSLSLLRGCVAALMGVAMHYWSN